MVAQNMQFLTWLVVLLFGIQVKSYSSREIVAVLNPGCLKPFCFLSDASVILVHVAATGDSDIIHQIWDFAGKPTVLIAVTELNTSVSIDWKKWRNRRGNYVHFSSSPFYSSSLVLNRIWQYNDKLSKVQLPNSLYDIIGYNTENLTWTRRRLINSTDYVLLEMVGENSYWFGRGEIRIILKTCGKHAIDDELPFMVHSENGTQIDLVLNRLNTFPSFSAARFAIEVVLVASERPPFNSSHHTFDVKLRKSLDDEHTPGVFNIINICSPHSLDNSNGTYLYYRPVSYTHPDRVIRKSTDVHNSLPAFDPTSLTLLSKSLAGLFHRLRKNRKVLLVASINITFGQPYDGFYTSTRFNSWTFQFGYGTPPEEIMSMFVVIVTTVGFIFPLMSLLFGGCIVLVRRLRSGTVMYVCAN